MAAQQVLKPGESRPEPPPLPPKADEPLPELTLPPIAPPNDQPREPDYGELEIFIDRFEVEGSSVFSQAELARVTEPWSGRPIRSGDLLEARDAVSRLYVEAGYVTSGAIVPDQDVAGGIVRIRVIEGRLAELRIEGTDHFAPGYLRSRLARATRAPIHVPTLETALRRLEADPYVARLSASLEPGSEPGESTLVLAIEEASRYRLELLGSNERTPALGAWGGGALVGVGNLLGYGDQVTGIFDFSAGIRDYGVELSVPVTPLETLLGAQYRHVDTEVVDAGLPSDIEPHGTWESVSAQLQQPLLWDPQFTLDAGLELERIETESLVEVAGRDLCLLGSSCDTVVVPLRAIVDATRSWAGSAVALRSTLSFGLDALGADRSEDFGKERFVSWLAQAQAVHILPWTWLEARALGRVDLQLSSAPLLPPEKLSIGGRRTVRGYAENQFLRDDGVVASVELQVPVFRSAAHRIQVDAIPFVDFAHAWNESSARDDLDATITLVSIGLGARLRLDERIDAEVFWGFPFDHRPDTENAVQNAGFSLGIRVVLQ